MPPSLPICCKFTKEAEREKRGEYFTGDLATTFDYLSVTLNRKLMFSLGLSSFLLVRNELVSNAHSYQVLSRLFLVRLSPLTIYVTTFLLCTFSIYWIVHFFSYPLWYSNESYNYCLLKHCSYISILNIFLF